MSLVISRAATGTPFTCVTPSPLHPFSRHFALFFFFFTGQSVRIKRLALAVFNVKGHTHTHTESQRGFRSVTLLFSAE